MGNHDVEEDGLSEKLRLILGDHAFVMLVENMGGLRVFIPNKREKGGGVQANYRSSALIDAISVQNVRILSDHMGGSTIRVPLAREFRANYYFDKGYSTAKMVRLLGITESGLERMISRLDRKA